MSDMHPSWEQLAAFDQGTLALAEHSEVESHVSTCPECCRKLERVPEDSLIWLMRSAASATSKRAGGDLQIPQELIDHPRYAVRHALGSGGMGAVFLAEHRVMQRLVALKVIHPHLMNRPGVVERFAQEAKAAARLSHPNIITAFDADQAGGVHFLVMEYVPGITLEQLVRRDDRQSLADACQWIRQVALGLHHAHERGMVHRDIKPGNLLLTRDGTIKILDFGLSMLAQEEATTATPSGVVLGTPDFIAPEQALEPHKADGRADIYSLGCTLYYLLAGQTPVGHGTALQKLLAHQEGAITPLREVLGRIANPSYEPSRPDLQSGTRTDLPHGFEEALNKMLAVDPKKRFQSAAEVAHALEPFIDTATVGTLHSGSTIIQKNELRKKRHSLGRTKLAWALAGLVGLGAMLSLSLITKEKPTNSRSKAPGELAVFRGKYKPLNRVAISADCKRALVATAGGIIRIWDLEEFKEVGKLQAHEGDVIGLAFSADGTHALSGGMDGLVKYWDLAKPQAEKTLAGHQSWVRAVAFCPDGRHAFSAGNDGLAILWDLIEGKAQADYAIHTQSISGVAVSPNGKLAATAGFDNAIGLVDLTGARRPKLFAEHDKHVACVAFSRTSDMLLSGSGDGTARLWQLSPKKEIMRFFPHPGTVNAVALSGDAKLALTACGSTLRLWEVETGQILFAYEGHEDTILAAAFCPDGRRVVSGGKDGTARFWSLPETDGDR